MNACYGQIRTQVDLVGIRRSKTGSIEVCCIELKTTSHSYDSHKASYDLPCRNLPRITFGGKVVPNSERMGHAIQAAFGCHGLVEQWPAIKNIAMPTPFVLVATTTRGLLYKTELFPAANYEGSVKRSARAKKPFLFDRLPAGKAGAELRACLARNGHKDVRKNARVSCTTTISGRRCAVAIVGNTTAAPEVRARLKVAAKGMRGIKVLCVVHRGPGGVGWHARLLV
jgi:hypothetical protein